MVQEVNNLSLFYKPKCHVKIALMNGFNSGPSLYTYNRIIKRNIFLKIIFRNLKLNYLN